VDYLYADAAELRRIVTDLLAANTHSLRLLDEALARCAGLERTVRDLQAELTRARDPASWADAMARHPPPDAGAGRTEAG
jgi:hypothetical protein